MNKKNNYINGSGMQNLNLKVYGTFYIQPACVSSKL